MTANQKRGRAEETVEQEEDQEEEKVGREEEKEEEEEEEKEEEGKEEADPRSNEAHRSIKTSVRVSGDPLVPPSPSLVALFEVKTTCPERRISERD